ncbi:hypothetical protein I302_108627 [Kwoniella bestiolae CBS 10118]|uniref:LysM domain-containing protein n=1 Tax=Kwoniella bestiolae CBS 10118 TaxID=1296100 RepID=A0A1B9FTN5_9TREE|nr:hypothetical protein I302_07764 [Kwoniella bestiolae CBS 10118]OCF22122.1 hypothetical protein I302_07764 [Kwoniella bestiolae CBS 10118]
MSCQTCSSELTPITLKSSFLPPCCFTPICPNCITRNPRLKEYIPCLRCGDPRTAELKGGGNLTFPIRNGSGNRDVVGSNGDEVVFEIGDDEDDMPPEYQSTISHEGDRLDEDEDGELSNDHEQAGTSHDTSNAEILPDEEAEKYETVEVTHQIQRGDTLLSISRRYATDPHDLLSLNNLPYTALSTHPRILHTRKSLIISRRQIPLSKLSNLPQPTTPVVEQEKDEERERSKQLKRFQLLTKNTDRGIANTYLNLSELEETSDPLSKDSGESVDGKKKLAARSKENREERALEAFFEDDEWERKNGGLSKLTVKAKRKEKGGGWNVFGQSGGSSGISMKA